MHFFIKKFVDINKKYYLCIVKLKHTLTTHTAKLQQKTQTTKFLTKKIKEDNKMTQQEFTERTKVNVSSEEFASINDVYLNSDLNKDEFCKEWCKMNKTRVKNAKAERMENERKESYLHILFKWWCKWGWQMNRESREMTAPTTTYERVAMKHFRLDPESSLYELSTNVSLVILENSK